MDSTVSISPDVVREVARITTLATPGVLALVDKPGAQHASRDAFRGVEVAVRDKRAHVRLRLVAAADVSLIELGHKLQTDVSSAVAELVGMNVTAVDVTFEDVRIPA